MQRQRTTDRLVGAVVAVAVLLLLLVVAAVGLLWWLSQPADDQAATDPPPAGLPPVGPEAATAAVPPDLVEGETWLGDLVLDAGLVATPDALLRDVDAVGRDVRSGPAGTVVGSLSVEATVPFEVVAAELEPGDTVRADGAQAAVVRTVDVAGRQLRVVASGTVEVVSGRIVVTPQSVDIGGPDLLSEVLGDVARRLVTIEHTVEGLPDGLVLRDVTVQDDGFRASLTGDDVRLDT